MCRCLLAVVLILFLAAASRAQTDLKRELEALTANMPATVGVAVIIDGRDTVTVNNDQRFPLMSVFKFHQALAVAHRLAERGIPLETEIWITKEDLPPNTWSPLRDAHPEGNFGMSIAELLRLTLQQSDNNACDILFDRICSVKDTEAYIHGLGIRDCAISATEADMHADLDKCRDNWTTPLAAARLMERFLTEDILPESLHEFIKVTMIGCTTGANRLARPLRETKVVLGHKTGTSERDADGRLIALNDAGFVLLPDGRHYTIAVFIKDSRASDDETEAMLAEISARVYRYIAAARAALP
ncbi:MAG: class A beta-lactamase, subclass A2 [Desulfovibrio sp.]|nr:class A beta-lactamase, subclass A2 [Desulfovibrio sp.]